MKFVLTNDDGIDAPGIRALQIAIKGEGTVVAPKHHKSGCSHTITTTEPIHVARRGERAFAVDGTPADCARLAITHLCPDANFVLSGINAGGNLGADVYISGTVAAVREAAFLGVPGIAVSLHQRDFRAFDWETAARWTAKVIEDLLALPLSHGEFWNVNLPHLDAGVPDPEVVFCAVCTAPKSVRFRLEGEHYHFIGDYADRPPTPGGDFEQCLAGKITVSKLIL